MIDSVEVAPFLSTVSKTERRALTWTTLVCGGAPSRTWATSRMVMVAPLTTLTGKSLSASIEVGALFSRTLYCVGPILTKPAGLIWFCAAIASETSCADSPWTEARTGRDRPGPGASCRPRGTAWQVREW
jgi:hypothetical protein